MAQVIGQGGTATFLDATVSDGAGNLVNGDTVPLIDVIDANGLQVVTDVVAQATGVGLYRYPLPGYVVAGNAPLGIHTAHWTTVVNGAAISADDFFAVVLAGSIGFPPDSCESWVTVAELEACCANTGDKAAAIRAASHLAWDLSGRSMSTCPVTWSVNNLDDDDACGPPTPGRWRRGRDDANVTRLPLPVGAVFEVAVAGTALPTSAWALFDGVRLVRHVGTWPTDGSLTVTAMAGTPPSELGRMAVVAMACELLAACAGSPACKLPARVQSIVRQGVSHVVLDPQEFLDKGRTGLPAFDQFLSAANPAGLRVPLRVLSPDTPVSRRLTGGTA